MLEEQSGSESQEKVEQDVQTDTQDSGQNLNDTLNQEKAYSQKQRQRSQKAEAQVEKLTKENMVAQNEVTDIRKKFAKHNLGVLSLRKPKLIENIVNRGTKAVGVEFEKLTNPYQFNESSNSISIAVN